MDEKIGKWEGELSLIADHFHLSETPISYNFSNDVFIGFAGPDLSATVLDTLSPSQSKLDHTSAGPENGSNPNEEEITEVMEELTNSGKPPRSRLGRVLIRLQWVSVSSLDALGCGTPRQIPSISIWSNRTYPQLRSGTLSVQRNDICRTDDLQSSCPYHTTATRDQLRKLFFDRVHTLCPVISQPDFLTWYVDDTCFNEFPPLQQLVLGAISFAASLFLRKDQSHDVPSWSCATAQRQLFAWTRDQYWRVSPTTQGHRELVQAALLLTNWSPFD